LILNLSQNLFVWLSKWSGLKEKLEKVRSQYRVAMAFMRIYFRRASPSGLKTLFKLFVSFLKDADLIGCKIIAIDGTKSKRTTVRKFQSKKKIETFSVY
jgi:hypothetical protein